MDRDVPTEADDPYTPSDSSSVGSESPNVEIEVDKNGPADLSEIWLKVSGNGNTYTNQCTSLGSSNPRTCSFSPSLSGGNSYDVDWNATDSVGNSNSGSWSFTVDTSYDGDSSAEFEFDDGYVYEMEDDGDDFEFDVTLGDSSDEDSDIKLKCYAGSVDSSNLLTETDFENVGSDGHTYQCDIPADDEYIDESVDVVVKAFDEAGNNQEIGEISYTMDLDPPIVSDLESSEDTSNYNENFDLSFEATDSATSVDGMEYFFDDESTAEGDGTSIENFDEGSFTVDVSGLEKGDHTVYIRAKDEVGRWSGLESYEFTYFPNAEPTINLTVPEDVEMTATEEKELDFTVENTGKLMIEGVELDFTGLFTDSASIGELEPGEDVTVSKSFTPEESDIGEKGFTVSAEEFNVSKDVGVRVKASESQQESISSRLETYQSKLESLRSNTSSLKSKLNSDLKRKLESNVSTFESNIKEAQTAIEAGEYYRAQEVLSGIDSDYSAAKTSYETVEEQHRKNRQRMIMMAVIGLVVIATAAGGAFAYHEGVFDDYDLDMDGDLDLQVVSDKLGDLGSSGGGEESEDEFDWDGFS